MELLNAVVRLEKVSFRYPKSKSDALSQVSLEIPQGSFFALLGPNGAGKTTLLRLLCGRMRRFKGSIKIDNELRNDAGFLDSKKYGVLLENPGVYSKLTIEEYLQFFSGFYGLGEGAWLEGGSVYNRCMSFAERLNLPSLDVRMDALSLGNRQKVQIVRALLHNPKLLILDEPVANLDPNSRETVWKLLDEWRQETHGTALVCSHVLAEMEKWATDYAVIDRGQVLKAGANPRVVDSAVANHFELDFANPVAREQVEKALKDAGMTPSQITIKGQSLADIYYSVIQ
ncbi:MAG: ABC transporter ATP-binding protein [Fibrobacter sp.]|nr:ABC transporter ATP-binding protein [Fibrobacter sp.]